MRITEVSPRLYLGDYASAKALPKKITHVVTVDPLLPEPERQVKFLRIPVYDDHASDLLPWFPKAIEFLRLASDDAVEFPHDVHEGYQVTVRLRRDTPDIRWGISWHQGLFKKTNTLVVDDIVEDSLMGVWNGQRFDDGWQVRYGDRLDLINGHDSKSKEGRADLQRGLEVTLIFWRNRIVPRGASLIHCHAGVSRSVAVIIAYWTAGGIMPQSGLRRIQAMTPDAQPNEHFMDELSLFWAMNCSLEGATEAHKCYRLYKMRKEWEDKQNPREMEAFGRHIAQRDVHERMNLDGPDEDIGCTNPNTAVETNELPEAEGTGDVCEPADRSHTEFRCRRCRFMLLTSENQIKHECVSGQCTSLFIQPMNWMGSLDSQTGKLVCVCGAKLGSYSWFGLACSCKAWQTPAFQIHRARLDEMPIKSV